MGAGMQRKLAAGNWKMNGLLADLAQLDQLAKAPLPAHVDTLICPPATLIHPALAHAKGSALAIGAQDCHAQGGGAFTGDIAAVQLRDLGSSAVIVGHSERREGHGETDALVAAKAQAAQAAGLCAIVCLGETLSQRQAGDTLAVIGAQFAGSVPATLDPALLVLAYEPVWAIGSGLIPTLAQIAEVHSSLRAALAARFGAAPAATVRLLYGGSVKPDNAAEVFGVADVDGALVGGASLNAQDFSAIVQALAAA